MSDSEGETREVSPGDEADFQIPAWLSGDSAEFRAIYETIRRIARKQMKGERVGHSFSPTDLIHEVILRLVRSSGTGEKLDRAKIISRAVRTMRCVLIDHARKRGRIINGGDRKREPLLDDYLDEMDAQGIDLLILSEAIDRFATLFPRHAEMIQMRIIGGMSDEEIGDCLHVETKTVKNNILFARATLLEELRR
jgi:RNA polymerase sigma factor (TIGR02999 family)